MQDIRHRVGQLFMVGFEGLTAPEYLLEWLAEGRVAGVILFARNVASPAQLAQLTASIHAAARYPALISIDQEGGTVARLRNGFTESPGAMALSVLDDPEAVAQASRILADEMHALGINWDYAPVLDILYNVENPSLGTRSFGASAGKVARLASAAVRGLQAGGVAACAKHFPGLGDTALDTHLALPTLDTPVEALTVRDLLPYRAVLAEGLASVMTTHTRFSALDREHPATLSAVVINRLLREELGFDGVVTTDCMEMKAIADHYGAGESAVLAVLGGVDLVLFSHTRAAQEAAYDAVLAAVESGRIPLARVDEANRRTAAMQVRFPAVNRPDVSAIRRPEALNTMQRIARDAIGLDAPDRALPLVPQDGPAVIEFASVLESGIMESGGLTGFISRLQARAPHIPALALRSVATGAEMSRALALAARSETLVLVTRNAFIIPEQRERAARLVAQGKRVIHVCLRSPFDAGLFGETAATLCTSGDASPSLDAAIDALFGVYSPQRSVRAVLAAISAAREQP
jgi:beta-N-acetylhexosaminidase